MLVPRGYYVLNEEGARLSIKANIDAKTYFVQWKITDVALAALAEKLAILGRDNAKANETILIQEQIIKLTRRKLFWAHFREYSLMAGTLYLSYKIILKP